MFKNSKVFSSFSVNDIKKAKEFYSETLGINVKEEGDMGLTLQLAGGTKIFIYPKENHTPASFTILNFPVEDIDIAAEKLNNLGIQLERYEGMSFTQDEKGILRGKAANMGPDIAWVKDPAGNILSILEESE
jgi:predicted enzyme related to lactoylglutathione lyase